MIWPDSWALLPWKRPMIAELDTDMPDPDSPTMPSVWPAVDRVAEPVDGLDDPVAGREVDLEVLDDEEGLTGRGRLRRQRLVNLRC
jgi:hypothetical protein